MAKEVFKMEDVNAQAQANRDYDYRTIAQPIFMKVQMGKATMDEFNQTVAAIDARYPFVTQDLVIDTDEVPSINALQGA